MPTATSDQLELELPSTAEPAAAIASPLPHYIVTPDSTPASVLQWWNELSAAIDAAQAAAAERCRTLEHELARG